jgi:hypothetical protein
MKRPARHEGTVSRRITMAVEASLLEAKAHELIGQLGPDQLAAVVQLLEVMVHEDDEPVTDEDRRRFHDGQAWFARRGGRGIPMEDVLAEFGVKPEDFPLNS